MAAGRAQARAESTLVASPRESRLAACAPKDAYAAVEYHARWFWITDTDIQSKYSFAFVMMLFSISGTGLKAGAPVVTVPAQ